MKAFYKNALATVALILLGVNAILAFQDSSLKLRIVDQNDDLIPNVVVRLKSGDGKIVRNNSANAKRIILFNLKPGKYNLEIEAKGFKPKAQKVEIRPGINDLTIKLEIIEIVENVEIKKDPSEVKVDEVFSNFLTKEEIAALPDDPEELKKELKRRYGEDTIIRIDGYTGRIPHKSQIASIKVSQSSFDAENHELGFNYVDIYTKVADQSFTGNIGLRFNDEAINARNPFAQSRLPEQTRFANFFLMGPIRKDQSSFSLSVYNSRNLIRENIVAQAPKSEIDRSIDGITEATGLSFNITQNLPKDHIGKFYYDFNIRKSKNLGVGGFNLVEKAYSIDNPFHQFRFSESGYIKNRFLHEMRFQFTYETVKTTPQNNDPAIIVLDAFSRGGAGNGKRIRNQRFLFADNLLFGVGKHALKIGGLLKFERVKESSESNLNGTFLFSSINDFNQGIPAQFTRFNEARESSVSNLKIGAYIQDDFKIRKNLGLSLGLRYEWQNNLRDFNNFSPRMGFVWSPIGKGKLTLRGGGGIFYNWLDSHHLLAIRNRGIQLPTETIILNPEFPNALAGGVGLTLPESFWKLAENLRNPYVIHFSSGVQSNLSKKLMFRANYSYQKGVHQFRSRNINAPLESIRPNSDFGNIIQLESSAFFVRNSLRTSIGGRLNKSLSFGINYTLAKKISDNAEVFRLPSNNYDLRSDRSAASDDQRHRVNAYVNWLIRNNLQFSTIHSVNSPLPYTITTGLDDNQDTVFNDRPLGVLRNSERGDWQYQTDLALSYFFSFIDRKEKSRGVTVIATSGAEANTISRRTNENKRFSIKIFARVSNVFNQTNNKHFVGVQTSPFFGQPISAHNSRRIDLGMRFNF